MRLFGLIGYPLSHSFSKNFFDEKFEKEGLTDCRFENFPITSIQDVKKIILKEHPDLNGLAVTIPYKQLILSCLDSSVGIPTGIGACNCIRIADGKMIGYNTDHVGFEKSLSPLLKPWHKNALVLGNGGSAASIIFVLKKLGILFNIVSREIHDGSTLTYKDLNSTIIKEHPVIINTTPLGMYPHSNNYPDIPYEFISEQHLVYDLIYNPSKTVLLQRAEQQGAIIKNGEEMLVLQAEENWRIWNS